MSKILDLTSGEQVAQLMFQDANIVSYNPLGKDKLPYDDGTFDIVIAHYMLNKLAYKHALGALQEWTRVLVEGGLLYVLVPSQRWIGQWLMQAEVEPHVKVLLFGAQNSNSEHYFSVWNTRDLRMLFEAVGLATVKMRTGPCEVQIGDKTYEGEQIMGVGRKDIFVSKRLKGQVQSEQSSSPSPTKRRRRRSSKASNKQST